MPTLKSDTKALEKVIVAKLEHAYIQEKAKKRSRWNPAKQEKLFDQTGRRKQMSTIVRNWYAREK